MTPFPLEPAEAKGPMRLVLTAAPEGAAAQRLVAGAITRRLAACASAIPIGSTYWWKGRVERAKESLILFKTVPKRVGALFRFLEGAHPYAVPEIVELDVPRVNPSYLRYLVETLDRSARPVRLGAIGALPRVRRRGSRRAPAARAPVRTRARHRRPWR